MESFSCQAATLTPSGPVPHPPAACQLRKVLHVCVDAIFVVEQLLADNADHRPLHHLGQLQGGKQRASGWE